MTPVETVFTALFVSVNPSSNGAKGLAIAIATLAAVEAHGTPEFCAVLADLVKIVNEVDGEDK